MRRPLLALTAALGALLAQSGIGPPLAGYVRDGAGALRPVYGMAGSLVLGEPLVEGVIAAAFSGRIGLAQTRDALYAFDREGQLLGQSVAPGDPARFTFVGGGIQAQVHFSGFSRCILWKDGGFESGSIAECEAPVLPIFSDSDELVFRKADGTELRAKTEGPVLAIEQMGEDWFCVHQADRRLAVRLFEDRLEISRLPEAAR